MRELRLKPHNQKQLGVDKVYFFSYFHETPHHQRNLRREPEAGADAEAMETVPSLQGRALVLLSILGLLS